MVSQPIRYDSESLPEREQAVLAHLDAKQYCPPVHRIAKDLNCSRDEVRDSLRNLAEAGFVNIREVRVVIDRPEFVR